MLPQSPSSQAPCSPVAHPPVEGLCPTESPEGTGLVSVGTRPLLLGSSRNATQSPADSSTPRHSSSLSMFPAPRSPILPSARWSSYTPPLSPVPSFPHSLALEVKILKARLSASEALVMLLTKEKYEAVDASRRAFLDLQTLQENQVKWLKEKEELIDKLNASALDEDDATPVVSPPSEGVWFAGSTKPPRVKSFESEPAYCGPSVELKDPQGRQTQGLKEKDEETPVVSPSSEAVSVAGSTKKLQLPNIRITPPAPSDADSEPVVDPSPVSTATTSSFPRSGYLSPTWSRFNSHPRARYQSRQHGNTRGHPQFTPPPVKHETTRSRTPQPTSSRQPFFNGLGLRLRVPHPIRWLSARRQRDLIDLNDPLSESPARKVHNARMRVLQAQANGPAHSRPSTFDLASPADLEASMIRVSISTTRPRTAAPSANWLASNPPQVQISSDFLRGSANEIGGESRTSFWSLGRTSQRRSASDRELATIEEHAVVESERGSSPLAPSSSRQVTTPGEVGEPQPKKNTGLRKLLKKGRSVISRFV